MIQRIKRGGKIQQGEYGDFTLVSMTQQAVGHMQECCFGAVMSAVRRLVGVKKTILMQVSLELGEDSFLKDLRKGRFETGL
nr:hypothetical protein BaRGS_024599 [Batillaria attramentaria]